MPHVCAGHQLIDKYIMPEEMSSNSEEKIQGRMAHSC